MEKKPENLQDNGRKGEEEQTKVYGGMLFDLDSRCLSQVRYTEKNGVFTITSPKMGVEDMPARVFLVTEGEDREKRTTLLRMKHTGSDESGFRQFYEGKRLELEENTLERKDVRADISVPVEISGPTLSGSSRVLVKNISAGGIFFVADQKIKIGTVFAFKMPLCQNKPVFLVAEVLHQAPMEKGMVGHGCRLLPLDADAESQIRRYVFQQLQRKS